VTADFGAVPCVFYHTGVCTDVACPYSHAPLTDETRKIVAEVSKRLGITTHVAHCVMAWHGMAWRSARLLFYT
jgi:hypothetical protein